MVRTSRRILLIAATASAIIVLAFGLLFGLGGRPVKVGPLSRGIAPWATTVGRPVQVNLSLDSVQLPRCDQPEKALDVVLALDRSDSMQENNALGQAANAAVAFAQLLQGQAHRVGIIAFNHVPQRLDPLGVALGELRIHIEGLVADGGTNITDALVEAGAMLREAARPDASQVIVLLSDGGAQEPNTALQVAQQLKDEGILLITVGLPGSDFSPRLLQSLASTPNDFYETNVPNLPDVYRGIARGLRSAVASNVKVNQPYPAERFEVDATSVQPSFGIVTGDLISWGVPVLREAGASFSYRLRPKSIGWHDVAGSSGEVTMLDCNGAALAFPLALGPRVFVSPIPPFLWLLLPFFFVVPLFILGGRGKPVLEIKPRLEPLAFDFTEKPAPFTWLDDVLPLESHAGPPRSIKYTDALVVGVGRSGRHVLSELRRLLREQSGGQMPDKIRLLWIEARLGQDSQSAPPSGLEVEEVLTLQPNLQEVTEQLEKNNPAWAHLHWWGEHTVDDPGRAGARMALFYDLMLGEGQSKVWRALRRRLDGLQQPLIYVIGSLADPAESGLALDLPHFIRQATEEMGTGARRVITMFLLQRAGTHIAADRDAGRNTYAAVRELQRILLRERFVFEYNPHVKGNLVGSTKTTPIDACYLLDGRGKSEDLSRLPEESALYPTVADALVTLLSSDVATWHQDYINKLPDITGRVEKKTGRPTVSSLGVSVVAYPMAGLKRACQARFLLDLLFGGEDGKSPLGLARLDPGRPQPTLEARAGLEGLEPQQRALDFLKAGGNPNRHPLMGAIGELMSGVVVSEETLASYLPSDQRIDRAFLWSLRDELLVLLNGTGPNAISNRTGKLGGALAFLRGLTEVLRDAELQVPQRVVIVRETELRSHLVSRISSWRRIAENTLAEAQRWEAVFVGEAKAERTAASPARTTRRRLASETPERPASLYETLKAQLTKAQEDLARAAQPPLRKLVGWDKESQLALYQRYLGPELLKGSGLQPLEQAMRRLGWWAVAGPDRETVELRLIVVEPDKDGRTLNRYSLGYTPEQAAAIQEALLRVATHFLPLLEQERFSEQLKAFKLEEITNVLLRGVKPLITYDRTLIGEIGGTVDRHLILTLEDEKLRSEISNKLKQSHDLPALEAKSSDDPYRCALVGLTDAIPIQSLEAIDEASLDYSSDPLAHIFPAEREAARLESEWRLRRGRDHRFHPRFVRLFDNADLARLIVLADLYGLITRRREGNEELASLSFPADDGLTTVELARGVNVSLFHLLERAFDLWLTAEPSHPLSRNRWSHTRRALDKAIRREREKFDDLYTFAEMKRDEADERLQAEEEQKRTEREPDIRPPWEQDVDVYLWLLADAEKREALK